VIAEFHSEAPIELNDAVDYYNQQQPNLGRRFADEVRSAVRRIEDHPEAWSPVAENENLRRCLAHGFPYGLIYQIQPHRILIVAVANLHRRPSYWRSRVD
jgi:toxin ParE1/3/4